MSTQSTSINQLPDINNIAQDDEDNTIHEVLAEIQNENQAQQQGNPQPPVESIQQLPPQPPPQQMQQMQANNDNLNSMLDDSVQQQLLQRLSQDPNFSMQPPSKFNQILNELTNNVKDFVLIVISFLVLQNDTIQNFLTSKLININVPHINLIVLALSQVVIILIGRTFM